MKISMKYSTVDEYLTSLEGSQPTATYPVYEGDFMPYIQEVSCPDDAQCTKGKRVDYWNGFYSTRTHFKAQVRRLLQDVRTANKLFGAYQIPRVTKNPLTEEIMANLTLSG
jgi:hypothetical protein